MIKYLMNNLNKLYNIYVPYILNISYVLFYSITPGMARTLSVCCTAALSYFDTFSFQQICPQIQRNHLKQYHRNANFIEYLVMAY